jgi:peptidoglycan-associated lipoprotein
VDPSGTRQVNPTQTTVYNFSVTGDGGVANASATLVVTRIPMPTVGIRINPTTIKAGESATLSWTSNNADQVTIDSGVGRVEPTGTRVVRPAITTRYTASATGRGGTSQGSVEITVIPLTPVDELFVGNYRDIFFDYDKYNIRDDAQKILQENVRWLQLIEQERGVRLRFRIEGHCDERGTTEYNLALGDRRATATKNFLISLGLPADRIVEVISYGEERPFALGHDEEAWAKNRRAHFVFVP